MSADRGPKPFASSVGTAPAYWQRGLLWNVLMSADDTAGEFTFMEQLMPRGAGPRAHCHERAAEGFYLLDGEIEFKVGDNEEATVARPGTAVWVPKGTRHSFTVVSETARALNFYTPGGFDDHMRFLATPATVQALPPTDMVGANDLERLEVEPARREAYVARLEEVSEGTWLVPPLL